MYKASLKVSPLDARPELISYITGLKFLYVGDTEPQSKLTIGICHLWLWARFMATQIWDRNFARNCELTIIGQFLRPVYSVGQCLQHIKISAQLLVT